MGIVEPGERFMATDSDDREIDVGSFRSIWVNGNDPECFYCGEVIDQKVTMVYWAGHPVNISLHKNCAERLGTHLLKDSRTAEIVEGNSFAGKGIVPRIVMNTMLETALSSFSQIARWTSDPRVRNEATRMLNALGRRYR